MIKKYIKNGKTFYMVNNLYLGVNPITRKEIRKSKKGFHSKREAQIYINKLKSEYDNGNLKKQEKITVEELAALFLNFYEKSGVKIGTYECTERIIDRFVSNFGKMYLTDVTFQHMQKYFDSLSEKMKVSSLNNYRPKINLMFKFAIRTGLLEKSPVEHTILPRKQFEVVDEDELFYSKEELKNCFTILNKYAQQKKDILSIYLVPLFRLLAFTGARIGELLALTWDDFDFQNNIIHITKNIILIKGKFYVQTPKNPTSVRSFKVDDITMKIMKELKLLQKEFLFSQNIKNTNNIVFFNTKKEYFSSSAILQMYKRLCKRNDFKVLNLHGFRHTHCSLLFEAGASIQEVQKRLGHSDIKTTMNIYNHVSKKIQEQTSEKFAKYVNF